MISICQRWFLSQNISLKRTFLTHDFACTSKWPIARSILLQDSVNFWTCWLFVLQWNSPAEHNLSVGSLSPQKSPWLYSKLSFCSLVCDNCWTWRITVTAWFISDPFQESILFFLTNFIVAFFVINSTVRFQSFRFTFSIIERT